jgi:hypothetical protein
MKKHLKFKSLFLVTSLFLLVLVGCSMNPLEDNWYSPYRSGALQGKGIRIEAEDGSFVIEEGKFTPPFQTYHSSYRLTYAIFDNGTRPSRPQIIEDFNGALIIGAKRVKVYHPSVKQPLYGILLLNKKRVKTRGAAAQSYLIRIPESRVNDAKGGRVSVVYETVSVTDNTTAKLIGWALWLSDVPF